MDPRDATIDKKPFLSLEQLMELWEVRGMRFGCDEIHAYCRGHGMHQHIDRFVFRRRLFSLLEQFLVAGEAQRDPQEIPPTVFKD